ncbi:hypothetical protein UFOVP585_17 [uncultured Caudovirales phage]|uniref:Uncharacterized protein n=1 Tax=uncultured Caudovirales phage TaxID=2100421 RepID=A0A6J5MYC9_9CAUD|nr:hypothetical protein UFOVP585_17 [uncultured Caudovirales phage]
MNLALIGGMKLINDSITVAVGHDHNDKDTTWDESLKAWRCSTESCSKLYKDGQWWSRDEFLVQYSEPEEPEQIED